MSSTINTTGSTAGEPSNNGQSQPQIIHFDATARRKDKMRQKALNGQGVSSNGVNGHAVAAPQTKPAQPATIQPVTPVAVTPAVAPVQPVAPAQAVAATPAPVATSPATAAAAPAVNAPAASSSTKKKMTIPELEQFLIDFVVEQTGYPTEMVEMDADLEADLGIDSIKKAQMFGEIAEQVELEVELQMTADMSLDDFPTLRSIIEFVSTPSAGGTPVSAQPTAPAQPATTVQAATPAPVATPVPVAAPVQVTPVQPVAPAVPTPVAAPVPVAAPAPVAPVATPAAPVAASQPTAAPVAAPAPATTAPAASAVTKKKLTPAQLEQFLIDFVVEQTGYPSEMVELDADLEADLGIDSIKKAQMFGEIIEQVELDTEIEMTPDMSLDDFPTLRSILAFVQKS